MAQGKQKAAPKAKPEELPAEERLEQEVGTIQEQVAVEKATEVLISDKKLVEDDLVDDNLIVDTEEFPELPEPDITKEAIDSLQAVPTRNRRTEGVRSTNKREDPVKTYLREIGKVPLLSREEEVDLAIAMEAGARVKAMGVAVEAKEQLNCALLSKKDGVSILPEEKREELKELIKQGKDAAESLGYGSDLKKDGLCSILEGEKKVLQTITKAGKTSRERLTISNLRLVVSIAKRYMNRGLSFLDLIQEGNMGLMKAVEKFDYTRGFKFSTYATWWIRQAITRAIADQSRTIRVPVHMIETVRELKRIKREFIQAHGAAPTLEDLSAVTGMSVDKIKKVENVSQYTASLERPIGDEEEDTLGDFIEDPSAPSPTKETFRMFLKEQLNRALDQLDEREREILKLRYGLDDDHPRTLKDVSLKFNITRERVRQIEIKAIEKLKHPSRRGELKRFRELLLGEY
jgi:RNA polymerase primary sigma factor